MNNTQEQKTIPLLLKNGEEREATLSGNNAAWMCVCGYRLPLIWSGHFANNNKKPDVECDECKRIYTGKGAPDKIIEKDS